MTATLYLLDSVTSTQDRIQDLAMQGAPAGTAVMAAVQTAGRGRRGRVWHAPRGGLWLSVLCRPASEPALEVLSLRVALATAQVVERHAANVSLKIKWPNDLILNGRKLGGILCEAHWQGDSAAWVAVGVGINLANPIPPELEDQAVTLNSYAPSLTPVMLAQDLVNGIVAASEINRRLSPREIQEFTDRDWLAGAELIEPARGTAGGITPEGLLKVIGSNGVVELVRSGTVVLTGRG
ncbi:MAG TPA: biotin--[acetyl-CoA-carboxylase] ligase [Gemmatimonadales bacterium]|nr:biotin--[acetyl-CoA-carboxylase] ligase [Gemmatimonadales bacterium]